MVVFHMFNYFSVSSRDTLLPYVRYQYENIEVIGVCTRWSLSVLDNQLLMKTSESNQIFLNVLDDMFRKFEI